MRVLPHEQHMSRARMRELRAQRLQSRFKAVSAGYDRAARPRRASRRASLAALILALLTAAFLALATLGPWPAMTMLRRVAAFPNCAAARAVGLAPAMEGQPGYWPWHDADHDGRACEPWPHRYRVGGKIVSEGFDGLHEKFEVAERFV